MADPDVDHIIATHDPGRPIERAVASVLDHTRADVRVTVVCHNTDGRAVRERLAALGPGGRLRVLDLDDGIPSPSGPFNLGLAAATATFTSIMGSDDTLDPGAIDSWLAMARRTRSDVVLPRMRVEGGGDILTPPTRPWRSLRLNAVRDRLAYRTSPLGLISRSMFGTLRFPPGLRSGEDIEYVTAVWHSAGVIALDRRGPAYVVHSDAPARASTGPRPVSSDAAFLPRLFASEAYRRLRRDAREALIVKILRLNVLTWVAMRPDPATWTPDDLTALSDAIARCLAEAPRAHRVLSRTDRRILDSFQAQSGWEAGLELVRGRTAVRPGNVLTRDVWAMLSRQAPLRFGAASLLMRSGRRSVP